MRREGSCCGSESYSCTDGLYQALVMATLVELSEEKGADSHEASVCFRPTYQQEGPDDWFHSVVGILKHACRKIYYKTLIQVLRLLYNTHSTPT